jgi:hypothetical protein
MNLNHFDLDNIPTTGGEPGEYAPLPAGWYSATVADIVEKTTKDGTGEYLNVRLNITGPTHAGRVVFTKLNIVNNSATAQDIGRKQLAALCDACGFGVGRRPADTDELIGGDVQILLSIRPESNGYKASNDVKAFKPANGAPIPKPGPEKLSSTSFSPTAYESENPAPREVQTGRKPWEKAK